MDMQIAPLSADIEAVSEEIARIEKIHQSLVAAGFTSATMEADRGTICYPSDFDSRLLVAQQITAVELAERIDRLRDEIAAFDIPPGESEAILRPSDRALSAEQLALRYREAGEHPAFPLSDWRYEVANEYTNAGYWAWLSGRIKLLTDGEVADINSRLSAAADE